MRLGDKVKGKLNNIEDLRQLAERFYISGEFKVLNCFTTVPDIFNCNDFDCREIVPISVHKLPVNMTFDAGVMVQYKYKYQPRNKYKFHFKDKRRYINMDKHKIEPIDGHIVLYFNVYSGLRKTNERSKLERYYVCEPFVRSEENEQFTQDGYEIYKEDIEVKILT